MGEIVEPVSFWEYAFKGGVPSQEYNDLNSKIGDWVRTGTDIKINYTEYDQVTHSRRGGLNPLPSHGAYVRHQLLDHWNDDVDLVIATGHGKWIAELVTHSRKHKTTHSLGKFYQSWGREAGKVFGVGAHG